MEGHSTFTLSLEGLCPSWGCSLVGNELICGWALFDLHVL
jgi:hypothetical protein